MTHKILICAALVLGLAGCEAHEAMMEDHMAPEDAAMSTEAEMSPEAMMSGDIEMSSEATVEVMMDG